jgi:hypothetical protein
MTPANIEILNEKQFETSQTTLLENLKFESKEISTKLIQNVQSIPEYDNETKFISDKIKSPSSQNSKEILIELNLNEITSKATRESDDDTTTESDSDEGFTIL